MLKVSVITACFNSEKTIEDTILSVLHQTYKNIEYIIIDGASADSTLEIIQKYRDRIACVMSEKDKGIYDAMNKGIKRSSGDIIALLNSDDFYKDEFVVEKVVHEFERKNCDSVYADLVFVKPDCLEKWCAIMRAGSLTLKPCFMAWCQPTLRSLSKKPFMNAMAYTKPIIRFQRILR